MRIVPRATLRKYLCVLLLALASAAVAQDQSSVPNPDDRKSIEAFISSMAQAVYKAAWPTATYRDFSFDGVEGADGGFNILVTLDGQSEVDQSDLWVQLAFLVRSGGLQDIVVRKDNHFLVAPFATTKALASVAADLAKQYADQQANGAQAPAPVPQGEGQADPYPTPHFYPPPPRPAEPQPAPQVSPQPAPQQAPRTPQAASQMPAPPLSGTMQADGACLVNATGHALTFDYRWGALKWIKRELPPNQEVKIWWPYGEGLSHSPPLAIRYDDDFAPGYTERDYNLLHTPTALPVSCDRVQNYRFVMEGSKVAIYTMGQ
ncbi:MAG TPA: hypothetical protein VHZ52_05650 [Acidobacteriaceae bacterium]|jgi:hypothetical protein|nr:hypothetical protein [Acidobacteriaceae bacterium]